MLETGFFYGGPPRGDHSRPGVIELHCATWVRLPGRGESLSLMIFDSWGTTHDWFYDISIIIWPILWIFKKNCTSIGEFDTGIIGLQMPSWCLLFQGTIPYHGGRHSYIIMGNDRLWVGCLLLICNSKIQWDTVMRLPPFCFMWQGEPLFETTVNSMRRISW